MHRHAIFLRAWHATIAFILSVGVCSSSPVPHGKDVYDSESFLPSRRLLVDAGPGAQAEASITTVTTASQLQAAAVAQAQDIEIRQHLDLTTLGLAPGYNLTYILPSAIGAVVETRSIRGNCTTPPPAVSEFGLSGPEFQWQSPQCVLICDHNTLDIWSNIWLDALYIRAKPSQYFLYLALVARENAIVYGSRLTVQGDGNWNTSAVVASGNSKVYIEDSLFLDVGGETPLVGALNASVVVNRTTFTNVVQRRPPTAYQPPTVEGPEAGQYLENGVLMAQGPTASLIVQDCEFNNVTAVNTFWKHKGGYVAAGGNTGAPDTVYDLLQRGPVPVSPLGAVPRGRLQPLRPDDDWWLTVRTRLANVDAGSYVPETEPPPAVPPEPEPPVNGTAPAQIAAVYTPADFQRAFHSGVRDIELRGHMDMRGEGQVSSQVMGIDQLVRLGAVKETTRSVRGNCTSPPPPALIDGAGGTVAAPEPWAAPRCVIVLPDRGFTTDSAHVWVDAVHVQIANPSDLVAVAFWVAWSGALFLTNSVVQGEDERGISGLEASNCRLGAYVRDTTFNELPGLSTNKAINTAFAPLAMDLCVVKRGSVESEPGPLDAGEYVYGAVHAAGINATLALQNTTFVDTRSNQTITVQFGAEVYSDDPAQTAFMSLKREIVAPEPLSTLAARAGRAGPPLTAADPWFLALQEVLADPPPSAYLPEYPPPGAPQATQGGPAPAEPTAPSIGVSLGSAVSSATAPAGAPAGETLSPAADGASAEAAPDGDMSAGAIAGIVVALLAGVSAAAVLLVVGVRRKRKRDGPLGEPELAPPPVADPGWYKHGSGPPQAPPPYPGHYPPGQPSFGAPPGVHAPYQLAHLPPGARTAARPAEEHAARSAVTHSTWSDPQRAAAEELEIALDAMHSTQATFYHRYTLLSAVDRRPGGQGVVQFASIANTQDHAAIKFYLHREAFRRERELYTESQLRSMMPATLAIEENTSGECRTPQGYTFPPFVIIERGQSLDEFARDNSDSDFVTIFQALSHAVRALRDLHSFGYAHRDIKPGNILRRPKQHDWTLIDFGCAAKIGSTARLSFSLAYAAPEVIYALEAGSRTVIVDAAVDIWAVGVIAFELLTGARAFTAPGMTAQQSDAAAQEAISGRALLPWESGSEGAEARLAQLRGLRRTVLRCLERDPAERPTSEALLRSWDHTFDNMKTRGTDWSAGSG